MHIYTYHQKTFPVAVTAAVMKFETESCVIVSCSRSGKTCAAWVSDWTREGAASSTDTAQQYTHALIKLVAYMQL